MESVFAAKELSEIVCCRSIINLHLKDESHIQYYQGNEKRFLGIFEKNVNYEIKPYCLCKYAVTQRLFYAIMGYNPSTFAKVKTSLFEKKDLRPVENVSWYDCILFCNKLTEKKFGKSQCVYKISDEMFDENKHLIFARVECDVTKNGYRLPTETEWEFAARGGNIETDDFVFAYSGIKEAENLMFSFKKSDVEISTGLPKKDKHLNAIAWYSSMNTSFVKRVLFKILKQIFKQKYVITGPHEVGKKIPNRLGLYDMSGNVWEWCYDETNLPPVHEETAIKERIMRGGGWPNFAYDCCVSERYSLPPEWYEKIGFSDVGFRLCRSL